MFDFVIWRLTYGVFQSKHLLLLIVCHAAFPAKLAVKLQTGFLDNVRLLQVNLHRNCHRIAAQAAALPPVLPKERPILDQEKTFLELQRALARIALVNVVKVCLDHRGSL